MSTKIISKERKRLYLFPSVMASMILFLLLPGRVFAEHAPDPVCDFYGYEETGGVLKAGDVITVKDPNGVVCGAYTVAQNGRYGFLSVAGDEPDTPEDEGANVGDIVHFFLNGNQLTGSSVWVKGGTVRFDIGSLKNEEVSVNLHVDFNQICFAVMPEGLPVPYKASQLILDMAGQGITIDIVMQWDGALWISHRFDLPFTDFNLNLDQGIFVSAVSGTYNAGTWIIRGERTVLPKSVSLYEGWNLVSIPTTISTSTVIGMLQQINAQGGTAEVIMWWDGAMWVSSQVNLPFTDQQFVKGRSYFIRCANNSLWEMS